MIKAQEILESKYNVSADVWSVTSYTELYREGHACERWNMLHPGETPRVPYVTQCLDGRAGRARSPRPTTSRRCPIRSTAGCRGRSRALGTDGFGRSETRAALREFFEVDYRYVIVATLAALARDGKIDASVVAEAIKAHDVNPEKANPAVS